MKVRVLSMALAILFMLVGLQNTSSVQAIGLPQQPDPGDAAKRPICLQIPQIECDALYALYTNTNGANWVQNDLWLTETEPCTWFGVACAADPDGTIHVTSLNLNWNQLQGSMPPELGNLIRLRLLDLSGNELNGALPEELGNLVDLVILNVAENQLAGEAPVSLSTLPNLTVLHIYENRFAGFLPVEYAQLSQLRNFKFQNTFLCVPDDDPLEAWLDGLYFLSRTAPTDCQPINVTPKPLVLIYAVLDNDLSSEWERLVNNAEKGVRSGAFDVRMLVDSAGDNNSYEYTLQEDYNDSCPSLVIGNPDCNRYRLRHTLRSQLENTAHRDTLINFVRTAILEHPQATHIVLSLVGHGAGWGANGLPSQPRGWTAQGQPITDIQGGILWDDTPTDGLTETQSMSTKALGSALSQIKAETGKGIDLLYLDACSMAMVEVAYEVRDSVEYLLASENTKWATFPYDRLLPLVANMTDGGTLGQQWIAEESAVVSQQPSHPYTFSLVESVHMDTVMTATTNLVTNLSPLMTTNLSDIQQAYTLASHFDSDYDEVIDASDSFVDLADFARQLEILFADQPAVVASAQAVQNAVGQAVINQAFDDSLISSAATGPNVWSALGGLSIYLPLSQEEARWTQLYNATNLDWAAQSNWDDFLDDYWQISSITTTVPMPTCQQTTDCPYLNGWGPWGLSGSNPLIYLPLVSIP